MRFTRLSLVALTLVAGAAIADAAFANEHGAPPPEGGEGGEGKAAAPPREQKEFTEKTTKLNGLAAKIEEARKRFEDLVKEKEEAKTSAAKVPALKEMVEIAKQREKDQAEYDKLRSEIAQRYPNQGTHVNRHKPAEHAEHGEHAGHEEHGKEGESKDEHADSEGHAAKPDKIAVAPTLDGLLDDTKRLIDQKYAPFLPKKAVASPRAPASVDGKGHRPVRLRLEE